jgi:alkylation response protein AidB-like acyl-CoA dehydrogenase
MIDSPISMQLMWTERDPAESSVTRLVAELAQEDTAADDLDAFPTALWDILDRAAVRLWSLPRDHGGEATPRPLLIQRYAQLATGSLTAVFILSQHDAAVRRLLAATRTNAALPWLDKIARGEAFSTVGISHLTTSKRMGPRAVSAVEISPGRYQINGTVPWVTAAERAQMLVIGATLEDNRQMLIALPADRPGVSVSPAFALAALQASRTAQVVLENVEIDDSDLLVDPATDLMANPGAVGTAGLETSALALGQAHAALTALVAMPGGEALIEPLDVLCDQWQRVWSHLIAQAKGVADAPPSSQIRVDANALALNATQAYLTASKGTGFLRSEPAQRWARQALFFLVWSCPTPVARASIRELAGLCPA